uniref:DNA-directed RNA polymerase subunit n=1 Tax=Hirondellea gigas TaxID=1518452 RepID=A0A2P2I841_9CRUS
MEKATHSLEVNELGFRIYSESDIDKISVMQVTTEEAINSLGHCNRGGVYDLRMGPMAKVTDEDCETCMQRSSDCMGHCGHIDLPLPVFNPFFVEQVCKLLNNVCLGCGALQAKAESVLVLECQMQLCAAGYSHEALNVPEVVNQVIQEQVLIGDNGEETKAYRGSTSMLFLLRTKLAAYSTDVTSGNSSNNRVHTSNVRSVSLECQKAFWGKMKTIPAKCRNCGFAMFKVLYKNSQMVIHVRNAKLLARIKAGVEMFEECNPLLQIDMTRQFVLTPLQARDVLRQTMLHYSIALSQMFPFLAECTSFEVATDVFFIRKLLVIPPKYRPLTKLREAMLEHESSVLLRNVLRLCRCMHFLADIIQDTTIELAPEIRLILNDIPGATDHQKADKVWQLLQGTLDNILDATSNSEVKQTQKGIKQIFEKKAGLVRSNLMGKRVNFSARSVLAPDPALAVDEVGVPMDFAKHLHYPVPVTPWNVAHLRKLVINGPSNYPGAHMLELEDGRIIHLKIFNLEQRTAFAKKLLTPPESTTKMINHCKIVYRQLRDGDLVLMNRQPTLHRPSIQAHRARVMDGVRVLRLPYANCKAYNADFDGDEMNLHFPQNELARSEAQYLVTTHNQYLTPKDGSPLAGLVQDCVVAGVMLSVRGTLFNREDYMQLVNVALQDHKAPVHTLPPCLIKPKIMWSGKQIISTILHNLIPHKDALPTFKFRTSVKAEVWQEERARIATPDSMGENEFIMRDGELVCGVVDKSAIGSTSHGLIHVCYDLYGGVVASSLLTAINRLCMYYLQLHGHTISCKEFLTPHSVAKERRDRLAELVQSAPDKVLEKLEMDRERFAQFWQSNHASNCERNLALIDAAYTSVLGKTTSQITTKNEQGLFRRTLDNSMRLMVDSGAKGSKVNMNQMASLFGPTAMDGKRMPLSLCGKSLPSFPPYDMNPRAGGYINTRFMTGMDPQSYFFLCIVGRDSLQHTAVKTANSGYMQRCLIKHLEGIQVKYDMTVRNSDGLVLQFEYGEDGLDVTKVPFLKSQQSLDVVVDNYTRLLNPKLVANLKARADKLNITKKKKKVQKWMKKHSGGRRERCSGFLLFCREQGGQDISGQGQKRQAFNPKTGRTFRATTLQEKWMHLNPQQRKQYEDTAEKLSPPQPDPIMSRYSGNDKLGVITEKLEDLIDNYYSRNYSMRDAHMKTYDRKQVETTISMKALKSHVDPGEAVGAICAQAIGEPLTQMTLNTFHFAGRDELNVTLGVPRMVEILRTASSNISTPIMEVPFFPNVTRSQAEMMKKKFTEVTLKQVLHKVEIECAEACYGNYDLLEQHVKMRFTLLPTSHYKQELPVTAKDVLQFMENYYFYIGIIKRLLTTKKSVPEICGTLESQRSLKVMQSSKEDDDDVPGQQRSHGGDLDQDAGSDNDDPGEGVEDDDDLADSRRKQKQNEQDYDDDEEEENSDTDEHQQRHDDDGDDAAADKTILADANGNSEDEGFEEDEENKVIEGRARCTGGKKGSSLTENEITMRRNSVISLHDWVVDYHFDTVNEEWAELTLHIPNTGRKYDFKTVVSSTASKAYVHRIKGIKRAFIEEKAGVLILRTEGVNVYKLVEWANLLDINRLYMNDLQLVAKTFGIEAAQRSIIKEIRAVQRAYNITVDYRHLTLLADYFTCDGLYKACNRGAMATCQSTLQQMSYESTLKFLKDAITSNYPDRMQSPSARVMLGQVLQIGTNVMDILWDCKHTIPAQKIK